MGTRVPWPRARDDLDRADPAPLRLGRGRGRGDDAARDGGGSRRRRDAPSPASAAVLVRQWNTDAPRLREAIVFADQEGGTVKTFRTLAPWRAASQYGSAPEAFRAGRETATELHRVGVHVTFAPVLDLPDGPLGSRQFAKPEYGIAFARGLGSAACVKHFPGLGSTPKSTDVARV